MLTTLRIQAEDFDLAEQYSLLRSSSPATTEIGAIVTFTGLVREFEPRSRWHASSALPGHDRKIITRHY
jgi:molybdopterin synthase catalytic subunit